MPTVYRSDQTRIQVQCGTLNMDNVSWDSMTGGDIAADSINYLPGGMQPAVELGGIPKRSDIVVTRIWSDTLIALFNDLDSGAGNMPSKIKYSTLDGTKKAVTTITYGGVLKAVARPDYDAATASEGKLTLTFGCDSALPSN